MSEKLNLNFSYSFEGNIWHMLTDPEKHHLIIEVRDAEEHTVSYTAIDLQTKEVLWDGLAFEENWWVGLTAFQQNVILFHQLEDSQNPENRQLFAVDLHSCEVLWAVTDFTFLHISGEQIVGFTREGDERHYSTIHLRSGEIAQAGSLTASLLKKPEENEKQTQGIFPVHYPEQQEYFESFKKFIHSHTGREPVKGCDYLEFEGLIMISYYLYEGKGLSNFLIVVNEQGEELLHEKLDEQLPAVGMDTFFIIDNQLIFIKRKKEIKSYAL